MMYRMQDGGKGQVYMGFFMPDPKNHQRPRLIRRTQARTAELVMGHFFNQLHKTARDQRVWPVQFIMGVDWGKIDFFKTCEDAHDAIVATNAPGGAWMYVPTKPKLEPDGREFFGWEKRELTNAMEKRANE